MREKMAREICLFLLVLTAGATSVFAQATGSGANDEAAVRQAGKDYMAAMDRGDTKAAAEFWTADGTYTDEKGHTEKVREQLEKSTASGAKPHAEVKVSNAKIRFVTGDVAIEDGDCETTAAGSATQLKGHYTAMWVRQNGHWKLDSLREMRSEGSAAASNPMASLEVFAGDWTGEANKISIHMTAKWDAGKKFMRREMTISSGGKPSLGGAQEIGWDPLAQHIKSWMFNDDGSFGEGLWSLEGNEWMVLSSRAFPDGRISNATQIYKFPDKNTMVWKVIRGSVDGQATEDFEITLKRGK